ncbi:MAG TPA: YggS family pyridoxal phosphate-dependent enzyme [Candidatus Kryptonia bacterium]
MGIAENVAGIKARIRDALARSDNPVRDVKLVAVSKTFPAERISEAVNSGLYRFGENRVQELALKWKALPGLNIEWHFIGHLQTNKAKKLAEIPTTLIHSVDRLEVALELEKQLQKLGEGRDVLVEVNTSGERTKSGINPAGAEGLLRSMKDLSSLRVKGLMTIGAFTEDRNAVRECFRMLRRIFTDIRDTSIHGVEMVELSMGMSGDYEIAVEEGATIVRIGTAVFGQRATAV